ncbi:MAG: phosphopantetheine-binding protein [Bacteroidetes bacterium]|nr:phosphopantetheine-binding protein [Bacteroidota bacterium]
MEQDLYSPIRETSIDSIDLVVIRVALEKHFGFEISDTTWFGYNTLNEAIQHFIDNSDLQYLKSEIRRTDIFSEEIIEISMPQMAHSSLSESWLLKYLGDKHWNLLSKGFNKKSSEFADEKGNRLYATFIRITLKTTNLKCFNENEQICFTSKIEGFGNNTFISTILAKSSQNAIHSNLITTFSTRNNSNNNEIIKGKTENLENAIIQIANMPFQLNEYRLLKKGLLEEINTEFGIFPISDEVLYSCEYNLNPYYEINGVGLLYFAAYPIISDTCLLNYFDNNRYLSFHTEYRDIFYYGNCNSDDKIIFTLNFFVSDDKYIKTITTLFRKSDNKMIAKMITVKTI